MKDKNELKDYIDDAFESFGHFEVGGFKQNVVYDLLDICSICQKEINNCFDQDSFHVKSCQGTIKACELFVEASKLLYQIYKDTEPSDSMQIYDKVLQAIDDAFSTGLICGQN